MDHQVTDIKTSSGGVAGAAEPRGSAGAAALEAYRVDQARIRVMLACEAAG